MGIDFVLTKQHNNFVGTKGGETVPNVGRPTNNPKPLRVQFRLSDEDMELLEYCAKALGKSKSEVIRQGIQEVYSRLKK